jgi:hypothetical protein
MSMLTDLKAAIKKHGGLARTNRFKVDFTGMSAYSSNWRDLEYFLEDVNIPSKDVETVDYSLYRNPIAYATGYKNGDFSMKFRAPTNMFVKRIFDRWIEKIIPREDYKLRYRNETTVDFTITQTSERTWDHDKFLGLNHYNVVILDAYPMSISSIEYSNTQEGEFVTFNVDFAFRDVRYFTPKGTVIVGPIEEQLDSGDGTVPLAIPNNNQPQTIPEASTAPVQEPTPPPARSQYIEPMGPPKPYVPFQDYSPSSNNQPA